MKNYIIYSIKKKGQVASLDNEINQRVQEYKSGNMKTVPFGTGLDKIKKKLESQI